jgi:hydrogenase maturation protease
VNLSAIEKVANAVLYEGYILYPYRLSATKNQRRFNFGVLVPPAFSERERGAETSEMRTECLVSGGSASLDFRVRFLQVEASPNWQEATEREVRLADSSLAGLPEEPRREQFRFPPIEGAVEISAVRLEDDLYRLAVRVLNHTALAGLEPQSRDEVLPFSLASTHTILAVKDGEFISLLDPPERFREAAAGCRNAGAWPALVGNAGERDAMLSSPIILYDYPQIAEESPGDLCDGTEIDEILTLRILTLTDDEKREMRQAGDHARRILERTEALPQEQLMKLHGVLRGWRASEEES